MAKSTSVDTTVPVVPMIYAYTTPEIPRHNGWTKIGYTEQDVETRIKQQTHTADVVYELQWKGKAIFIDDESTEPFRDSDFHAYLRKIGIEREPRKEWFKIACPESYDLFNKFRSKHGIIKHINTVVPYNLRDEQERAVQQTIAFRKSHEGGEFLWNAKPRFGKTLTAYDFCKRIDAKHILIVTNRPAIADSWYSDYAKFLGSESGYYFVSEVGALTDKQDVLSREQYTHVSKKSSKSKCIEFVSLQDLKGSLYFGGHFKKLEAIMNTNWDVLIIDEAHEGVDTFKTDAAFTQIERKFTLHLSGTPFKAIANEKFSADAIFNWTYAEEQNLKRSWDERKEEENPYKVLPQLNLFTYKMSDIVKEELQEGIEIMGETEEYAFDLNEFFKVDWRGKFEHDSSVDKFLDALTKQKKFPFSTPELRNELKHTFWLLNRVDSTKALAKKLTEHPIFKEYKIVLAAGDGKIDDDDENTKSLQKVKDAIEHNEKTITLSVGQLTTGVTIPQWTAVLMLSNVKSASLYMQAAFRAQNPCLFFNGISYERKENAYVFDFDPARTLTIFEEFANDLSSDTAAGRGDSESHKANVRKLLNFFPVVGEDEDGELILLDAEKVLTIPRKIRSQEVVRRGFMSDFLFQNISHVFAAPQEILDIIQKFEPIQEPKRTVRISGEVAKSLSLDENGDVSLSDDYVIGQAADVFGQKLYAPDYDSSEEVQKTFDTIDTKMPEDSRISQLKSFMREKVVKEIIDTTQENYGSNLRNKVKNQIEHKLFNNSDVLINRTVSDYEIKKNIIESNRTEELQNRDFDGISPAEINKNYDKLQKQAAKDLQETFTAVVNDFVKSSVEGVIRAVETDKKEFEKKTIENGIRDHLRGFSRSIPAFLMAYGDDTVTLATFDIVIPGNVFEEVTSITLDQFKFLRDGGTYIDDETGEEKQFEGQLFDSVVFDDSVREFLSLKKKLADYFDEATIGDIFDYIPPQRTNQIFTPKNIVQKMVDRLEAENPGCFDDPNKTFIDLYMKSGLYITEIVTRLYQSPKMKKLFPDKTERLKHIFEMQVYGLAPTEIIYNISISFILGFDEDVEIKNHNFRQIDAFPYVKNGTLSKLLSELYEKDNDKYLVE